MKRYPVRWTLTATNDLLHIVTYIAGENPAAAERVGRTIQERAAGLETLPFQGRLAKTTEARELVFPPWPYIAVYRVLEDEVRIIRVRHAKRNES